MPLECEVKRPDKRGRKQVVKFAWDYQMLSFFYTAAIKDQAPRTKMDSGREFGSLADGEYCDFSMTPIYYLDIPCDLVRNGVQTLESDYKFERSDGTEVLLKKGDVLSAYRSGR